MKENKTKKDKSVFLGFLIPIAVVIGWYYSTNYTGISAAILPKIGKVFSSYKTMIETGQLQADLSVSIGRVLRGYVSSIILGIILGTSMGMSKKIWHIFHLSITTIRQIPMMAWIPLIILWCGIGELSKTVIIVMAAFFPIMTNTLNGITTTPQGYIEVAQLYKLSKWKTFTKVYLPHALPHIFVGLKLGLGTSWMAVVAAELIAASSGIGFRLSEARSMLRSEIVIACMIVIGIVGFIMDKLITALFGALTPWEKKKQEV